MAHMVRLIKKSQHSKPVRQLRVQACYALCNGCAMGTGTDIVSAILSDRNQSKMATCVWQDDSEH